MIDRCSHYFIQVKHAKTIISLSFSLYTVVNISTLIGIYCTACALSIFTYLNSIYVFVMFGIYLIYCIRDRARVNWWKVFNVSYNTLRAKHCTSSSHSPLSIYSLMVIVIVWKIFSVCQNREKKNKNCATMSLWKQNKKSQTFYEKKKNSLSSLKFSMGCEKSM